MPVWFRVWELGLDLVLLPTLSAYVNVRCGLPVVFAVPSGLFLVVWSALLCASGACA